MEAVETVDEQLVDAAVQLRQLGLQRVLEETITETFQQQLGPFVRKNYHGQFDKRFMPDAAEFALTLVKPWLEVAIDPMDREPVCARLKTRLYEDFALLRYRVPRKRKIIAR